MCFDSVYFASKSMCLGKNAVVSGEAGWLICFWCCVEHGGKKTNLACGGVLRETAFIANSTTKL